MGRTYNKGAKMKTLKTIKITNITHRKLTSLGQKNESYSEVIDRIIQENIENTMIKQK